MYLLKFVEKKIYHQLSIVGTQRFSPLNFALGHTFPSQTKLALSDIQVLSCMNEGLAVYTN